MEKVFRWGIREIATAAMPYIRVAEICEIVGFIDNDFNKRNRLFFGKQIFSPEILKEKYVKRS